MRKNKKGKQKSSVSNAKKEVSEKNAKGKKRNFSDTNKEDPAGGSVDKARRGLLRAKDFKEKSLRLHEEKSSVVESKKEQVVNEEILALRLTQGQEEGRPNRRLIDFVVHDANGNPQPWRLIEVDEYVYLWCYKCLLRRALTRKKKCCLGVRLWEDRKHGISLVTKMDPQSFG
ncbi:hypothetical protein D5086_008820 [Populus alba]|uniref:DNA (Cytosine-5)-methyltransferase 1-like isoform X1 n=2 Tax=Populus alba TaxID=43335 RepID=A0A4U5QPU9_POPAL|nr:DNA (cytosine-5)-methyltransferase 1-like isoform X1 [Populus alba]